VVKILQGSVVTQTTLGGLTIHRCKFPVVYMCQKLWKLDDSRQSYCKNYLAYFFWPTLYNDLHLPSMVNFASLTTFRQTIADVDLSNYINFLVHFFIKMCQLFWVRYFKWLHNMITKTAFILKFTSFLINLATFAPPDKSSNSSTSAFGISVSYSQEVMNRNLWSSHVMTDAETYSLIFLDKKLSYCCDSRSYCMQKYDRLKQLRERHA